MSEVQQLNRDRQQYLDRLVEREQSPFVNRVHYDHDQSLVRETFDRYASIVMNDPRFIDKYSMFFNPELISKKHIERYLSSQDGRRVLETVLKEYFTSTFERGRGHSSATTLLQNPLDFGIGEKSNIYVYDRAFEKMPLIRTEKGVVEIPAEEQIKALLKHEYTHTEQNSQGVRLGEGLIIDNLNHHNIDSFVFAHVIELDAYIRAELESSQLGHDHPQHLLALTFLFNYLGHITSPEFKDILMRKKFTPYENRLIEFLADKVSRIGERVKDFRIILS